MVIGFLGLGQMGREMAARLVGAGHDLVVWNRSAAAAERFKGKARIAASPQDAMDAEVVISMLADDAALEAVWVKPGLRARGVHLNMATVSMRVAREGARLPAAAGPAQALERCQSVFKTLARQVFVVGSAPEQANAVKIARNFLLATVIEGLGEALALARGCGVDAARFVEILTRTSLAAPAYRNYGKLMVERAYEPAQFSMDLGLKDVELALSTALASGVALPSAELVKSHLEKAIRRGDGHKDWAAAAEYIK